ncbi:MAG: chemotaxis protein CheW, partial [Anaerolineae bacterium]|nr:chemotaxis protein CheW [Anaerolineae bacterium]
MASNNHHLPVTDVTQRALLTFRLGTQLYALMIEDVVEVAPMVELVTVVDAPPALLGLANRRGEVLPMIDLRAIFHHESTPINALTLFIVAARESHKIGLVVDSVHQVEYVGVQGLVQPQASAKYLRGVIPDGDRLIQIVSLPALLDFYVPHEWTGEDHD